MEDDCWIQTYSGRRVWPLQGIGQFAFVDIAHALSNICRFGGHTRKFYSVAQHCVHAHDLMPPEHRAWGLLHDAAEAYLGDVVRPIKSAFTLRMGTEPIDHVKFSEIEKNLLRSIGNHFGLSWPPPWDLIEDVDCRLLISERNDLMGEPAAPWSPEIEQRAAGRTIPILCMTPNDAEDYFRQRAIELGLTTVEEALQIRKSA